MKFSVAAVVFFLTLTTAALADTHEAAPVVLSNDFGVVDSLTADHIDHVFAVRNRGQGAITVDHLEPSCGCTGSHILGVGAPGNNVVPPGQDMLVDVTVATGDVVPGPFSKSVLVFVKGQKAAYAELLMNGILLPVATFSRPFLDFGALGAGMGRTLPLTVTLDQQKLPHGFSERLVSTNSDVLIDSGFLNGSTTKLQTYSILISPRAHLGRVVGHIVVLLTGEGTKEELPAGSVSFAGSVTGEISCSPTVLSFGSVTAGMSTARQIFVSGSEGTLRGVRVTYSDTALSSSWSAPRRLTGFNGASGNTNKFTSGVDSGAITTSLVTIMFSGRAAGPYSGSVTVTTLTGQGLVLPVSALVVSAGDR